MTFGRKLSRYIAGKFVFQFLAVLGTVMALIFFVESLENMRRIGNIGLPISFVFILTSFRLPWLSEQALPFAVLIASMTTFLTLSRSLELVVARGAGVSAWQFVAPVAVAAALIGIIATAIYNPLAAQLLDRHQRVFAENITGTPMIQQVWLRQAGERGTSVMYAAGASSDGSVLTTVTAYLFDDDGRFLRRLEADSAVLDQNSWLMRDVWTFETGTEPYFTELGQISTLLSAAEIRESLANAQTIGFWKLSEFIDIARKSGLDPTPLTLQYHNLLAQPLLLVAMVLIAASVSLRLFRQGNIGPMIVGGIGAGFLLYIMTQLFGDLAEAGKISPIAAAWVPATVALLLGATRLLHQEDG